MTYLNTTPMPMIWCAKCEMCVERVERRYNFSTRMHEITVFCHGAQETRETPDRHLQIAPGDVCGVAFDQKPSPALQSK